VACVWCVAVIIGVDLSLMSICVILCITFTLQYAAHYARCVISSLLSVTPSKKHNFNVHFAPEPSLAVVLPYRVTTCLPCGNFRKLKSCQRKLGESAFCIFLWLWSPLTYYFLVLCKFIVLIFVFFVTVLLLCFLMHEHYVAVNLLISV